MIFFLNLRKAPLKNRLKSLKYPIFLCLQGSGKCCKATPLYKIKLLFLRKKRAKRIKYRLRAKKRTDARAFHIKTQAFLKNSIAPF